MFRLRKRRTATDPLATRRHGVATAELAVCLPVVVLLVIASLEACSMIFAKQSLAVAAYEGARTALVHGNTVAQVQAICNQILTDRHIKGATITITPTNLSTAKPGDFIDVTVSAPCAGNGVVPNTFYRGKTLSATASMMDEF
jgi:Flp pilus assembly protein TadG